MTKPKQYRRYNRRELKGSIYLGDALKFLKSLPSDSAEIVFLDPPFNLGKTYSVDAPHLDRMPEEAYQEWMVTILQESRRVLAPGGALYLYHVPAWAMRLGAYLREHLEFRHWIAISMKNGFVRGDRLYPAHYGLLYYTKGKPTTFTRPKLDPVTCRHCGDYIKDYGGYTAIIEEKGLNLSDVWEDLSPVRHKNTKHRSANELPLELTRRIVAISGSPGGLFVEPFAGTGSGIVAAAARGMRFKACDIVEENCKIMCERLVASNNPATIG